MAEAEPALTRIRRAATLLETVTRSETLTTTQQETATHLAGIVDALAESVETVREHPDLVTDGGHSDSPEIARIRRELERQHDLVERQTDALERLADQTEIQNGVLLTLVSQLDRRNSIAMAGHPDEISTLNSHGSTVADGVLTLAEQVDLDAARRWADER